MRVRFVRMTFAVILCRHPFIPVLSRRYVKKFALLALMSLGMMTAAHAAGDNSDVINRIKLVGDVCTKDKADKCPVKAPAAAGAPAPGAAPRTGEQIVQAVCSGCHGAGVMGAPKIGTADWTPRNAKGKPMLYDHALHGFNMMPAKGGCAACSDDEIKNGVDYMVSKAP